MRRRRASNWQGAPSGSEWQAIANTTRHGYTGNEALDNVMLIHMTRNGRTHFWNRQGRARRARARVGPSSGRVYDPVIGRFQTRDPFIDGIDSSQGPNGYAYLLDKIAGSDLEQPRGWPRRGEGRDSLSNNPMSRWDPTGFARITLCIEGSSTGCATVVDPTIDNPETVVVVGRRDDVPTASGSSAIYGGTSGSASSEGVGTPKNRLGRTVKESVRKKLWKKTKRLVCSVFKEHGYGSATFNIGDGANVRYQVAFSRDGIYGFVGVGVGAGQSVAFQGGTSGGVNAGGVGLRTYASLNVLIRSVGFTFDATGGSNGADFALTGGFGEGVSGEAGVGVIFPIVEGDPVEICH